MLNDGRAPLDHPRSYDDARRAEAYAALQRAGGGAIGRKELALTRRPRSESRAARAARFLAIDRRGEA